MYVDILCVKGTFQIPQFFFYPYIKRCRLYSHAKNEELLDLKAQKCFWNAPWSFSTCFDRSQVKRDPYM